MKWMKITLVTCLTLFLMPFMAAAGSLQVNDGGFCSATAEALFRACNGEAQDDYWVAAGYCINISNDAERARCGADAKKELADARDTCQEQREGRKQVCKALGEERYDPDLTPDLFESDVAHLQFPNAYYPLKIGDSWTYETESEFNTVTVTNMRKSIEGITCIVVRDIVKTDGKVTESTYDWFAQAKDGTVWYFGEDTATYETFPGDVPMRPELTGNEGSFKAGRDGSKPGIIFLGSPRNSAVYYEEFSLGNAEDIATVISTHYSYGSDPDLDKDVPQELARFLCSGGDCVVTRNQSLLEPGTFERKYYARGIGVFLETTSSGEVVQLTNCNFDSRCSRLPSP